jgi:hypothetical protein
MKIVQRRCNVMKYSAGLRTSFGDVDVLLTWPVLMGPVPNKGPGCLYNQRVIQKLILISLLKRYHFKMNGIVPMTNERTYRDFYEQDDDLQCGLHLRILILIELTH